MLQVSGDGKSRIWTSKLMKERIRWRFFNRASLLLLHSPCASFTHFSSLIVEFEAAFEDLEVHAALFTMLSVAAAFVALSHKIVTRRMADKALIQFDLNINEAEYINLVDDHQPNRRRHTLHQIQVLEAFFRDCPNPDYKQRRALGLELGLEPQQVKFWFQNKRTQLKMQYGHLENAELRAENKRLKDENTRHMEHLENAVCLSCGSPLVIPEISVDEHQLRAENVRLREEIDRFSAIAARYIREPFTDSDNIPHRTAP